MEVERDFILTPPPKTVRFGDTVVNTLAKLKQVRDLRLYLDHGFVSRLKQQMVRCVFVSFCP